MKIEIGEQEWKRVGIKNLKGFGVADARLNLVAGGLGRVGLVGGPCGFEKSFRADFDGVGNFGRRVRGILENDAGFRGPGNEEPDGPASRCRVRSQQSKGVGVASAEQRVDAPVEFRAGLLLCARRRNAARLGIFGWWHWDLRCYGRGKSTDWGQPSRILNSWAGTAKFPAGNAASI